MEEHEPQNEAGHNTGDKPATEPRLEVLLKTLHHVEAIKHILDVSRIGPEPLELTLRNLEKLLDKSYAQVRDALSSIKRRAVYGAVCRVRQLHLLQLDLPAAIGRLLDRVKAALGPQGVAG